jgi:mono/diheme cytochrome c family protein
MIGLVCMALLIVAFPIYRLGEPARRRASLVAVEKESVALGAEAFGRNCAGCHGQNAGGGSVAPTLGSREFLSTVSDQQLYWLISGGIPGTAMSAYHLDLGGPFTPQEIDRIVRYLRSLEAGAPSVPNWRTGGRAERHEERERPHTPDRERR